MDEETRIQRIADELGADFDTVATFLFEARRQLVADGRWCFGCERPHRGCRCRADMWLPWPRRTLVG